MIFIFKQKLTCLTTLKLKLQLLLIDANVIDTRSTIKCYIYGAASKNLSNFIKVNESALQSVLSIW